MKEPIIDAANYSLQGDGKRLRPIVTWFMGVNAYGLNSFSDRTTFKIIGIYAYSFLNFR